MDEYFALVDCDNFFVSCERIFAPEAKNRPVVVLSNNDGCAVARSQEAKDLGIKMAAPYYQIKTLLKQNNGLAYSSNFQLYGNISSRIMAILNNFSFNIENYSIDEAFIELQNSNTLESISSSIVSKCQKDVGIPVKVGIGKTKTLAKMATELVKIDKIKSKYNLLIDQDKINEIFKRFPVNEIWGVGRQTTKRLNNHRVKTAYQLIQLSDDYIRTNFDVNLLRTVWELRGKPCYSLENMPKKKKNHCYSRTFSQCVSTFDELKESIIYYTTSAAAHIRRDKLKAESITVFIRTNPFSKNLPQYANSITLCLPYASNDTMVLNKYASAALTRIYKEEYLYKKSGVILNELVDDNIEQQDLFDKPNKKDSAISKVLDEINKKFGNNTIQVAASGIKKQKWQLSRKRISKRYTTSWDELLKI